MRVLSLALACVVAMAGAVLAQAPLRVGVPSIPAGVDPGSVGEGTEALIVRQVFDTLVRYADGSSDIEAALAVSWQPSRDGLAWSFRLRDGVRFHDGTPLTAQHVVASLERLVVPGHPQAPSPNTAARLLRGSPGVVRQVRAVDGRTVQVSLFLPYAPLLTVLAHPALSVAIPAANGGWQGTGPFALGEAAPGRLTLDGRPGHWAGGPRAPRLILVDGADETQALADLDAQSLDVLIPVGRPPRVDGALSVPGWRIGYLALQSEREPFRRHRARRAVAAALEPGALAGALGGSAQPLTTFLPPGVWARRDAPVAPAGGPAAARRLLSEAGIATGTPVPLLLPDDQQPEPRQLAEAIRDALATAGLALTVQPEEPARALAMAQAGDHHVTLWEARVEAGDPHFLLYPLSTSEGAVKGPTATNLSFYRNKQVDDLLIRASQLAFRPERLRLYHRAQAMLAEEMPWVPLYVRLHWAVARPGVRGLRLHGSGVHRLDRVWVDAAGAGR